MVMDSMDYIVVGGSLVVSVITLVIGVYCYVWVKGEMSKEDSNKK